MADEKIRLGGMALPNGVLVHGPRSWACAIRHPDGRLEVVAERKRFLASQVTAPLLRGPARLLESLAVIPQVKRRLPRVGRPSSRRNDGGRGHARSGNRDPLACVPSRSSSQCASIHDHPALPLQAQPMSTTTPMLARFHEMTQGS